MHYYKCLNFRWHWHYYFTRCIKQIAYTVPIQIILNFLTVVFRCKGYKLNQSTKNVISAIVNAYTT